jgi:hypothetical protein
MSCLLMRTALCLFVSFQMRARCLMEFLVVEWRVLGCLVQLTCCWFFLIGVDNLSLVCSSLRTLLWFEYLNLMPKFWDCWQCEVAGWFFGCFRDAAYFKSSWLCHEVYDRPIHFIIMRNMFCSMSNDKQIFLKFQAGIRVFIHIYLSEYM